MTNRSSTRWFAAVLSGALLGGCGGSGGGGGNTNQPPGPPPPVVPDSASNLEVTSFSTIASDGSYARVDLLDGGNPDGLGSADIAKRSLLSALHGLKTDLNNSLPDNNNDGVPETSGLESYFAGFDPGSNVGRILVANNLYDLIQTTTNAATADGKPNLAVLAINPFDGYTGGDIDADGVGDGGPGLFSNVPGNTMPKLPTLANTMGTLSGGGSGRGPSATDQHEFIQIVFPYDLDRSSLLNPLSPPTSYLGDTAVGATPNIIVEARWIQRPTGDAVNAVDQTFQHRQITGVAVIGGVTAIPTTPGSSTLATISKTASFVPLGARNLIDKPNVFTFIAHEDPTQITTGGSPTGFGTITPEGVLVLPDPTVSVGGGRVFGGNTAVPGSVNDFGTDGDQTAAAIGFVSFEISRLRTSSGTTLKSPYFHTFPISQAHVGSDPRGVNKSFNRGPALYVNETTQLPSINILEPNKDAIQPYNPVPPTDAVNLISTRARFRIDFDKEVVPNSVGASRQFMLHSTAAQGVVNQFNGNTRPVSIATGQFLPGAVGSPVAPSIYVAINQKFPPGANKNKVGNASSNPLFGFTQNVNSPFAKAQGQNGVKDDNSNFTDEEKNSNGLVPLKQNTLATLPRAVVPFDIFPLNQNNLQSYIIQPLVEMPPDSIVTIGVCMHGLGVSALGLTNVGNQTRGGTVFTAFQGLTPVGLGDDVTQKVAIIGNQTIIKVNAGPMDLQGLLFYGGTNVAIDRLINGIPAPPAAAPSDDKTTGGFNICRTFRVGHDNTTLYVNAPVSPQAIYLGYSTGGGGVLDLSGTGYNTNAPGGAAANTGFQNYLEVTRYLPLTLSGKASAFNWTSNGSFASGDHQRGWGIFGRYTSGGSNGTPSGVESELALGAAVSTGQLTPTMGINEGSSGYETVVQSAVIKNDPGTSTAVIASVASVGIVRDIEVGDFLDRVYFDPENTFATKERHVTYNTPLNGTIPNNSIADPPLPNPPPLRFPVGLNHTAIIFDQSNLAKPPIIIQGNEVFSTDDFERYDDGSGFVLLQRAANTFIQLNPTTNASNGSQVFDQPPLPSAGYQYLFPNIGANGKPKFVQTGPMPKTSTAGAVILSTLQTTPGAPYGSFGLVAPYFQSRQQIGNFLFVADGINKEVHAVNSNTMQVLNSVKLSDPYGLGLTPDLKQLFVSNEGDNSVSIVDANPLSATFMTELKKVKVGIGPRAVAADPNNEDVFVLNQADNTISILDRNGGVVRKTLNSQGINRPWDIAIGVREVFPGPGFQSGTYHAFISNNGGDNVLVFQSGPAGLAGIGFDNIIGPVTNVNSDGFVWPHQLLQPRGVCFDINAQLDGGSDTLGCFVAHKDQNGVAVASRITYTKDSAPGQSIFNTTTFNPGFGSTIFEVTAQYASTFPGAGADVALPDYNRKRFETETFGSFWNLFNAGATTVQTPHVERNWKFLLADNLLPFNTSGPRWEPDRLYLSMAGKKIIEVFDIASGAHLNTITTPQEVSVMSSYFSQ